jgi:hypothetical protein
VHQNVDGQFESTLHEQSLQTSLMVSVLAALQLTSVWQQLRAVLEQLNGPLQASPLLARARAS